MIHLPKSDRKNRAVCPTQLIFDKPSSVLQVFCLRFGLQFIIHVLHSNDLGFQNVFIEYTMFFCCCFTLKD